MPADAEFMITDRLAMRTASDFDNYVYTVVQSVFGMVNQPVIDKIQDIKQPTLIVFGANDNLIPNRYLNPGRTIDIAEYGASKIKNSTLKMIDKAGHFCMFEKPDECNQAIKDFLK
jgi:pimeloyl-ACP methyl ester carboxylesterase